LLGRAGEVLPDRASLDGELEQVRECGYALNLGEYLVEVFAIGVPVNDPDGYPVAALTVVAPRTRWTRRRLAALAPTLTDTAAAVTRDLQERGR
jgi:DNA-binding IclR family transcriptional regulator